MENALSGLCRHGAPSTRARPRPNTRIAIGVGMAARAESEQGRERDARGLPEVKAERAGNRVDLVEVELPVGVVEQEVDAGDAGALEEAEDLDGHGAGGRGVGLRERGRDEAV